MKNNRTIRAVFFDVGGVCLSNGWDEASREKAASVLSLNFGEIEKRHTKYFEDLERGDLTLEDYIDDVYFTDERSFSREDVIRFMKDQSRPFESTFEVLDILKSQGKYRLSTINNESFVLNKFRIEKFGLARYFDSFFSSSYLHMRKPEGRIFKAVLHITALDPDECLYIDDRIENIEAARYEGFNCIHLPDPGELKGRLKELQII
ncbi:MAG TPA: HAD family phosphatase [Bacteroidales bacterium]|nr:HAD family phosphatase [Bacteroidales bacterium]